MCPGGTRGPQHQRRVRRNGAVPCMTTIAANGGKPGSTTHTLLRIKVCTKMRWGSGPASLCSTYCCSLHPTPPCPPCPALPCPAQVCSTPQINPHDSRFRLLLWDNQLHVTSGGLERPPMGQVAGSVEALPRAARASTPCCMWQRPAVGQPRSRLASTH